MVLVDTKVCPEHCILTVDLDGLLKVECCLIVPLLLVEDVAQTPPSIVVSIVCFSSLLVALLSLLKVLIFHILMST